MCSETARETTSRTAGRRIKSAPTDPVIQPFVKKQKKSSLITNLSVFLPVWNPYTSGYQVPSFSNHAYVTGAITGQGILNLKARINNSTVGHRFNGNTANLSFNRYQLGSWVAYAVSSAGAFIQLTGAMNLTTMAEYFYTSDTDTATGIYV